MHSRALRADGLAAILGITLGLTVPAAAQIQVFSASSGPGQYVTPETISVAPAGFGSHGGSYFIPDASTGNVWVVPAAGGAPVAFLNYPVPPVGSSIVGGLFLPAGWGDLSGRFVVASETDAGQPEALLAFDGAGAQVNGSGRLGIPFHLFQPGYYFVTPLLAPPGFGNWDGHLFVSDEYGAVWRLSPDGGALTVFASVAVLPMGLEFTPPEWGEVSLLVSDVGVSASGPDGAVSRVVALSAGGVARPFADVALKPDQYGLRQMLVAPNDYFLGSLGISGRLLLVSVTGSPNGGGAGGELVVLDASGTTVGHLQVGGIRAKFDPRGILITGDGRLLVSDTSDPILLASAEDFVPGREEDLLPRDIQRDVLAQLLALRATVSDAQDGQKLDDAISALSRATDPGLWRDGSGGPDPARPAPKAGAAVFTESKNAVGKLSSLAGGAHGSVSAATLRGFVGRLVQADAILGLVSINDGFAAGVDPRRIQQAKKELAAGNVLAAKGKPESAIEQYRNAWGHALKG
ncbi:MAG TPA: hypothetical protein PLB02_02655 [Thermoanaerobaculia bacterium]|nr:hypothetical protein [Thermoanaerobaculia bacterium]HQR66272.1 hypothetical protein [Thermoanaerobaculia bacterium]